MQTKRVPDIELNIFDEDDWNFFDSVDTDIESNDYFSNLSNQGAPTLKYKIMAISERVGIAFCILFLAFIVIFACIALTIKIFGEDLVATPGKVSESTKISAELDRVPDADNASNDDLQGISASLTTYFDILRAQKGYSMLESYCEDRSNFALLEETYRTSSRNSYDADDCNARALRGYAGCMSLVKIDDVLVKDGVYYCYARVKKPNTSELSGYFQQYSYEMTKYFTVNDLTAANVSRFMLQTIDNGDLPTFESEWLFKFTCDNGMYKLLDDSEVSDTCTEAYNIAIDKIVAILGGNLAKNTYKK